MVNKRFWLGITVIILLFGMTVVGCHEELKSEPYPQSVQIDVMDNFPSSWDSSTPTKGSIQILFRPPILDSMITYTGTPAKVSVEDLQWLQASDINLELFNADGRTVSITSIEKQDGVVKLNLTRSAKPSTSETGGLITGTATVLITLPNDFTAKYPDGITWGNKTFTF